MQKKTNTPYEVLVWFLKREKEKFTPETDFKTKDNQIFLSVTGVLQISRLAKINVTEEAKILQELYKEPEKDSAKELILEIANILEKYTKTKTGNIPENKQSLDKKKTYVKSDYNMLPELSEEQTKWSVKMRSMIKTYVKSTEKKETFCSVVKKIYQKMTSNYGIVWLQCKKDFICMNNLDEDTKITNFRLVCYDNNLRSIFECLLRDYIEK